ncbi:hypothetical protein BU24DRAFT_460417 [Aaosphaeria arxii CBS 175.79]|uniref:Cyclin n=1 Tax=Aaosphaeria arxii CBS 175.79 TaxID=1450172 RepID=A0A6A5XXJ1_9PLEO|nr:uncharacterized protein BU24DRAFT_460417 [Aaosphaeria arxii CBS 175.79]KAF2017360.1 hypothetical protein BU24DRAFT_460417 [Aaosphaeria arxii CBS 175.79]
MSIDILAPHLGSASPRSHPYAPSLSSSASSSTSSIFSDAASQASNFSSSTSHSLAATWDSEEWSSQPRVAAGLTVDASSINNSFAPISRVSTFPQYQPSACREAAPAGVLPSLRTELALPIEQRQNPRRSSSTVQRPPQLVRQAERKVSFVDCLVDSATQMVETIWPLSVPSSRCEAASGRGVLPLRTFIQETLRRSRTSYSTLQVALYYLILIKSHVPKHDFTMEQAEDAASYRALQCGRRMFLAALILASKYLQDRNYSARAWSRISGLKVCEINTNEMAFLAAVNWKLHITDPVWERWQEVVRRHTPSNPPASPGVCMLNNSWKTVIPQLTPELEMIEVAPKTPVIPQQRPTLKSQLSQYSLRSPLPLPEGLGSQENTPTPSQYQAPRFLEPRPELLPPTPSLVRLGPLPTPILTPQSAISNTPAASGLVFGSRRPSMCSAMAQAQSSSLARSCVDQFNPSVRNGLEAYHWPTRRPSLAPSTTSSASSPESMVTDNSRSSRASSISSVSSAGWAPNQAKLARLATCRNARLPYPALSKCKEQYEYAPSEPMSSPDLESFHIDDSDATPVRVESPESIPPHFVPASRKRGRSSVDLQQNVRHLLHSSRSTSFLRGAQSILPDRSVAQTFLTSGDLTPCAYTGAKGLQSPKHTVPERRLPIQKDLGRKRTCCASEAAQTLRREGPGMWEGVL